MIHFKQVFYRIAQILQKLILDVNNLYKKFKYL